MYSVSLSTIMLSPQYSSKVSSSVCIILYIHTGYIVSWIPNQELSHKNQYYLHVCTITVFHYICTNNPYNILCRSRCIIIILSPRTIQHYNIIWHHRYHWYACISCAWLYSSLNPDAYYVHGYIILYSSLNPDGGMYVHVATTHNLK